LVWLQQKMRWTGKPVCGFEITVALYAHRMNSTTPAPRARNTAARGAPANAYGANSLPQNLQSVQVTVEKYDRTARVLHWLSAVVILWASISGFAIAFKMTDPELSLSIASFNVSITTIFIPFFIFRVWHRMKNKPPPHSHSFSSKDAGLASAMHILIYAVVGVVLISGVLMMTTALEIFHVVSFPQLIDNPVALGFFRQLHGVATAVLAGCVSLHLLALIKHEIAGRRIMSRML